MATLLVISSVSPCISARCIVQARKCRRAELARCRVLRTGISRKLDARSGFLSRHGASAVATGQPAEPEKVPVNTVVVVQELAKMLGLALVFAAFSVLGSRRTALAEPPVSQVQVADDLELETQERLDSMQLQMRLRQAFGIEDRLKSFGLKRAERESEYRTALGVDDLVKQLEAFAEQNQGDMPKLLQKLAEAKHQLRMDARRLQGKLLIDANSRAKALKREAAPLLNQLKRVLEQEDPALKRKLDEEKIDSLEDADELTKEFFTKTLDLRSKLKPLVKESIGSEFEGWLRAWYEIPEIEELYEAELEKALRLQEYHPKTVSRTELAANNLQRTADRIWDENVLPIAVNTQEPLAIDVDKKLRLEIDKMLRNHLEFAGDERKKLLPGINRKELGSPELYAAYGSVDVPDPEALKTAIGWEKWCEVKREDLKQYLLSEQAPQDELVVYRDRVLERTWYNVKLERWEMSPAAAVYAVHKNLVSRARLRQDGQVLFLSLKGETEDYAVIVEDLDAYLEKSGRFSSFFSQLQASEIPTTQEKIHIPFREWTPLQIAMIPVLSVCNFVQYIWNSDLVTTAREAYFAVLSGVAEEFMVRLGYPLIQKFPRLVRVLLGFESPKGDFSEPTKLMLWQKTAQERLEAKQPSLPWWMEFPFRAYIVVTPLLMFGSWAVKVVLAVVGPRKFPDNIIKQTIRAQDEALKDLLPSLLKLNKEPIKRAFDQMKRIRNPEVALEDFAGHEMFEEEVNEIVNFLRSPNAYKELGARPPRGVLIVGESGTGKTTLARAIASKARVPVVEIQSYDINGGPNHVGQKAANVRELFKTARQFAPVILFMDNLEHSVGKRGSIASKEKQEEEALINQFLVELDGFETQEGVVVLATTSYPENIDEALRRPGRMDRTIHLFPPTRSQRENMLREIAEKTMHPYVRDWVNWAKVAEKTEGFTYVDLRPVPTHLQCSAMTFRNVDMDELFPLLHLFNIYENIVPRWIAKTLLKPWDEKLTDWLGLRPQKRDVEIAVEYMDLRGEVRTGIELSDPCYKWTREFKYSPAVWAAGRGLVGLLLPNFDTVELLWLDRSNFDSVAFTKFTKNLDEGHLQTGTTLRSYLEKRLVLLHGSHIATDLLVPFLCKSDHARAQLDEAAEIATRMVLEYGWSLDDSPTVYMARSSRPMSKSGQEEMLSQKVTELLDGAWNKAVEMLTRNKHVLEAMVEELLAREHIMKEDLQRILQEHNAIFEEEPFRLEVANSNNQVAEPTTTNGRGRVITV